MNSKLGVTLSILHYTIRKALLYFLLFCYLNVKIAVDFWLHCLLLSWCGTISSGRGPSMARSIWALRVCVSSSHS